MKYILLTLFLLYSYSVISQTDSTHVVVGTVVDKKREPMIACAIYIREDRKRGTMADIDGNYSIEVKIGDVLVFSYLGYKGEYRVYKGETRIDVVLEEDCPTFSDHFVYYKSQRQYDASTALSRKDYSIDPKQDIQKGLISGLYLNSGNSLFQPQIGVRSGLGNIGGETKCVVNGIVDAPFNYADVFATNVIRDAASAVVYGSATAPGGIIDIKTEYPNSKANYIRAESRLEVQNAAILLPNNNRDSYRPALRTALVQHYDLKVSRFIPIRKTKLQLSGLISYDDIDGVIKGRDAQHFTSRITLDFNYRWFNLSQMVYYDKQEQNNSWLYYGDIATQTTENKVEVGKQQTNPRHEFFSASSLKLTPWDWLEIKSTLSYDRINNKGGRADVNQYMTSYRDYFDFRTQENSRTRRTAWDNTGSASFYWRWTSLIFDAAFNREIIDLDTSPSDQKRSRTVDNILLSGYYNADRGKYTASASIRRLSSSILNKEDVYLPTVSAAWRFFTEKTDCYRISKFSEGKLKASWSKTASNNLIIPTMAKDTYAYPDFSHSGLKWQVTEQANVGIDLAHQYYKLRFSAMYYYKVTNNILEYSSSLSNVMQISSGKAKIANQGVELNTFYDVRLFDKWWNLTGNFLYNRSSVRNKPLETYLILDNFVAPEYTYGAGTKINLSGAKLILGIYFEGNINQKMMGKAFAQPNQLEYVNVNYFTLKSLHASYSFYNVINKRLDLNVYMNADNLFYFADSSMKRVEDADFILYSLNRMFSIGLKVNFR